MGNPLVKETYKELTGKEVTQIQLNLCWEHIKKYLGYNPILSERKEREKLYSNEYYVSYKPLESVISVAIDGSELDSTKVSVEGDVIDMSLLKPYNRNQHLSFPYQQNDVEIEVKYMAGYKQSEIPLCYYQACQLIIDELKTNGNYLTSKKLDTVAKTFAREESVKEGVLRLLGADYGYKI